MANETVSPFSSHPAEPLDNPKGRFPHIVIRFMAAVYQRESIDVRIGEPAVHIGHRASFVQHPAPYAADDSIGAECRALLLNGVLESVRRTRHRMCVVWKRGACTFVEPDGTFNDSEEAPSGGVPLPASIEFEKRIPLSDVV
jgi:hypothetical protein